MALLAEALLIGLVGMIVRPNFHSGQPLQKVFDLVQFVDGNDPEPVIAVLRNALYTYDLPADLDPLLVDVFDIDMSVESSKNGLIEFGDRLDVHARPIVADRNLATEAAHFEIYHVAATSPQRARIVRSFDHGGKIEIFAPVLIGGDGRAKAIRLPTGIGPALRRSLEDQAIDHWRFSSTIEGSAQPRGWQLAKIRIIPQAFRCCFIFPL